MLLFLVLHSSLFCDMGVGVPKTTFLCCQSASLLGSANLKGRRTEQELDPSYLPAVLAIVTQVGLSQLLSTLKPASPCPSEVAVPARGSTCPSDSVLPLCPTSKCLRNQYWHLLRGLDPSSPASVRL